MATLYVVLPRNTAPTPAVWEAARALPMAKRSKCDRICVKREGGARSVELPVATVEVFARQMRLQATPGGVVIPELHKPLWKGV